MSKQKNKYQVKEKPPVIQQEIKKTAGWKPYLVFAVFAFILYSNTLNHFFAFDDEMVLTKNTFTQQGINGIPDIFKYDSFLGWFQNRDKTKTAEQVREEMKILLVGGRYRPLSLVTFALEVQFFGKKNIYPNEGYEFQANAFVSHLNNILLYLFTTCLLFLILCRLFPPEKDKKWFLSFPFIVSILFLAHPIHTEAIANIKGRDEIMTLLGSLAALWFTIKYFDTNKIYNLLLSGLCLFLGLLSKENAITFLAVIPVTIYCFVNTGVCNTGVCNTPLRDHHHKKTGKILTSMLPLIAAAAAFLLLRANVIGFMNTSEVVPELLNNPFLNATKSETLATIFYTLIIYVKLLFFPHPLTWDYYPYHIEIVNWTNPVAILSLLFYLGITGYAIYGLFQNFKISKFQNSTTQQLNNSTIISYSIWFYLLPLTIVSNLFFPIGTFMGERFVFISSIGVCIFIGWLIYKYLPKIGKNIKNPNYLTISVMIIILCLFSIKTISRNNAWKNELTLVETDIKTSKNSIKGNFFLGNAILRKATHPSNEDEKQRKGELCDEAAQYLKHAIELHPKYTDLNVKLGNLYFDCYKDIAKSLHYYAMALQINPQKNDAYKVAVIVLNQIDRLNVSSTANEILQSCDELLKARPDFGEAYYVKGLIYSGYLNDTNLSLINLEKAEATNFPKQAKFYADLGTTYAISANYKKALQYLLKAVELGANDENTYINLGIIYQQFGDIKNANFYLKKGEEMKKNK